MERCFVKVDKEKFSFPIWYTFHKPTIKKYLYSKVRSQFLRIDFDEAAMAVYLPVQQFKKAGVTRVWADSRSMI